MGAERLSRDSSCPGEGNVSWNQDRHMGLGQGHQEKGTAEGNFAGCVSQETGVVKEKEEPKTHSWIPSIHP